MGEGTVTLTDEILGSLDDTKEYEVIAMYYVPSGGTGVDCEPEWYVADHMDAETAADYINDWLGDANMKQILDSHSNIRAVFNDSYEFYSDIYYTEDMAELAADAENNGLGYDFSKYLPTIYKQYSAAPFYMGLGTSDTYLTYTADAGEEARIQYDYNTLSIRNSRKAWRHSRKPAMDMSSCIARKLTILPSTPWLLPTM